MSDISVGTPAANQTSQPEPPVTAPAATSAAALGLAAFALNLFIIGYSFTGLLPAQLVPLFLSTGIAFGTVEVWVGAHEYRIGSPFTGLVFGSFGAFWVGTGLLFLFMAAHVLDFGTALPKALGLYFIAWTILTCYLWAGSALVNRIAFLVFTVLMAALIFFDLWGFGVVSVKIGAWLGVVDAVLAFYMSAAVLLNTMMNRPVLPVGRPLIPITARKP